MITMCASLKKMKSVLQLETARMILHRRDEHGETARGRGSGCSMCDRICKKYISVPSSGAWVPVEALDDLARGLGVVLKGGKWDFGEFLMR